ncbi:alpha/beta hydrolase [Alicyclobacillus kakegawensis]|uniref:alpha/beta hydrolase n=1 Tax=Alicyclobacillus kakegawensis TaxID=392012 RepID=UPI000830F12D|nr:alpha/beta hydrolase [Alicyclobacillus kakegawensis]
MALRPHVKSFLESIPPEDTTSILNVVELRHNQKSRSVPLDQRPPVWKIEDILVPGNGRAIPIRIYTPNMQHKLPLLVYFHGGGFCIGSLESHDLICRRLANELGWKIIAVDYRLAPENPFPAGVEDCYAVTQWCSINASSLDINSSMIAVAGDSSGGNFATVVTMMARDRGTPFIYKQVLICPNTEYYQSHIPTKYGSYMECGSKYLTTERGISQFWSWYMPNVNEAHHPYVSPMEAQYLSNLPPALILTAEYDPLRDEGEAYARRLHESGVSVRSIRYEGTIHGFLGLFADEEESKQAYSAIAHFLKENGETRDNELSPNGGKY